MLNQKTIAEAYYPLFELMQNEFNLTLLVSDMNEIINAVEVTKAKISGLLKATMQENRTLLKRKEGKGLPMFLVIKDDSGTFEIWDKNRYETYVRKAVDYGATPAVQIVVGFNGDENFLSALPVADGDPYNDRVERNE